MSRKVIAGPTRLVTDAATVVGEMGGNVVDMAVVAAVVAMCTEPGVCAPGGGGYLTVDMPGIDPVVIDGYMAFPGEGFSGDPYSRTVSMEYGGGVTTDVDAGSIATPGSLAALAAGSDRFGAVPWKEIMEVAARFIADGFPMTPTAYRYLLHSGESIFGVDQASRAAIFDGDRLREPGETVCYPDLAESLRWIGSEGIGVLHGGELGANIVEDLSARGCRLTLADLASYEAIVRRPLEIPIGSWLVHLNPPPAVGGLTVGDALLDISTHDDPSDGVSWYEALAAAFALRASDVESSHDSEAVTEVWAKRLAMRSGSTIAVAAADEEGNAVSGSFSAGYGSGVIPKGTGLMMNNSLGELELIPGGLGAHSAGQRMLSNMAPSIARKGHSVMAIASPGADRITSALVISLARVLFSGDDLRSAIEFPRVHPDRNTDGARASAERGLVLEGIGVPVKWYEEKHMYFGGVTGAALQGTDLSAHADSRRTGSVAFVD